SPIDLGWILASTCFAAAALHPSLLGSGAAPARELRRDGRVRLLAIAVAGVTIPLIIGLHEAERAGRNWWAPLGVAALDVLVVTRIGRLFGARVRAESALERRVAQQAAVAALGRRAVEGVELDHLAA